MAKLTILRGDDYLITVNLTNPIVPPATVGTPFDLTGYKAFLTAVPVTDPTGGLTVDATAVISKTLASVTNPTLGSIAFPLLSADTNIASGVYFYDVQIESGTGTVTTVLGPDQLVINPDVTRRLV